MLFPEVAKTVLFLLNSYPAVALISLEIFSFGLKVTNNLASLLLVFGACKTGVDWAKQTLPELSWITNVSQSLNLPTFFISAKLNEIGMIKSKNVKINFLVMIDSGQVH